MTLQARRGIRFLPLGLSCVLGMAAISPVAHGLSIRRSLEERIRASDAIARATVVGHQSAATQVRGFPMVYTDVRLRVSEYLNTPDPTSPQPTEIIIRVPGGETADYSMRIAEVPGFKTGEELVVFLKAVADRPWQLVDGNDGKYLIARDPRTGTELIRAASGQPVSTEDAQELGLRPEETANLSLEVFMQVLSVLIRQSKTPSTPSPLPSPSPASSP